MNLSLKKETSNRATLLNIKEASLWASKYLNKKVTPSNHFLTLKIKTDFNLKQNE